MSTVKRGLGKGLESLLSSSTTTANNMPKPIMPINTAGGNQGDHKLAMFSGKTIVSLNISDVIPNPRQPRRVFHDESLAELANSIKEHGIIEPLLVRKKGDKYELVAGERRLRASTVAGMTKVPAVIRDMSDQESLELAIIENIQREDLNAIDEAESYQLLMKEFSLTQDQVAQKVGKARSSVANALRLIDLPKEVKESLRNEEITAGHARAILAAGDYSAQLRVWEKIKNDNLNVRDAEQLVSKSSTKKPSTSVIKKEHSLISIEQELSSKFSTKVELSGSEQKGEIKIKYFSRDDLDRVYSLLLENKII